MIAAVEKWSMCGHYKSIQRVDIVRAEGAEQTYHSAFRKQTNLQQLLEGPDHIKFPKEENLICMFADC